MTANASRCFDKRPLDWVNHYLNKPWRLGADGSDGHYDCWSLIRAVYAEVLDVQLPDFPAARASRALIVRAFSRNAQAPQWKKIEQPEPFCIVAMSQKTHGIHHAGLFVDHAQGFVLHCSDRDVSVCEPLHQLPFSGWQKIEFYCYEGEP